MPPPPKNPEAYKSQPWVLFDTIASHSMLMGDNSADGKAIGSEVPSISAGGEIVFFQSSGRTRANMPWFTNLDMAGQLAYGLQVWQVYLAIYFPLQIVAQTVDPNATTPAGVPTGARLAEAILNFGVLQLNLGQEEQIEWPLTRFGAGGGLSMQGGSVAIGAPQNSLPQSMNVMKLPEPIEMVRTQNLNAKIRLAPQVFEVIGSVAAPGVGMPLLDYEFVSDPTVDPVVTVERRLPPFAIQLGLVGRRVKNTQYGQLVRDPSGA
jgi:hypothetical protein